MNDAAPRDTTQEPDAQGPEGLAEALAGLPDWRLHTDRLVASYRFRGAPPAVAFIGTVGALAEEQGHHPDLDWRYNTVHLATTTHDAGGRVTEKDLALARAVSAAAHDAGAKVVTEDRPGP
jgi:4a-hydroxytetrahydrobiopterin dehydratase